MRRPYFERIEDVFIRLDHWISHNPGPLRAAFVLALAFMAFWLMAAALPLAIVAAAVAVVVLFARNWLREFSFLMGVDDSAFPGHHDKLIWALLLIVLPPVGVYLFRAHRRAYWPESETKSAAVADELS
jgi:hypothetical protein